MDDTLKVTMKGNAKKLTNHLNKVDTTESIKFTHEEQSNGSERRERGRVNMKVY